MTQAANSNTTRVADAILALINSKPRSPRPDELENVLASFKPETVGESRPDFPKPLPPLHMRPTELGWELIEKLMPAYVEAVQYSSSQKDDAPNAAEFEAWTEETSDAYWSRMREATNLVDLAIACRMAMDGDTPYDSLKSAQQQWECYDRHEGYDRPESVEEIMGTSPLVTYRLLSTILSMAGIDEARCSEAAVVKANGWDKTPTPKERAEALAKLRAHQKAA